MCSPSNLDQPKLKLNFSLELNEIKQSLGKRARVESLDDGDLILNLDSDSNTSSVGKRFKPESAAASS